MNPVLLKPGSDRRSHVVVMGRPAGEVSLGGLRRRPPPPGGRGVRRLRRPGEPLRRGRLRGRGQPRGDQPARGRLRQHGPGPARRHPHRRGGRHRPGRGVRGVLRHPRAAGRGRPGAGRGLRGQQVPRRREPARARAQASFASSPACRRTASCPWHPDLWLDSEDALDLDGRRSADRPAALRVAVVRLPRISNFTDVDALGLEPDVDVVFASTPRALADADLVVLPGTRATIADLGWLRERGLDRAIVRARVARSAGARHLRRLPDARPARIDDPDGVEGPPGRSVPGLGLLDVDHRRSAPRRCCGCPREPRSGAPTTGYEIHHGRVRVGGDDEFLGGARRDAVFGTMWHGSLEGDGFRRALLAEVATAAGREWRPSDVRFAERRESAARPARRPGRAAPRRRRTAPARGAWVTQATLRHHPCMRDSVSH